MYARYYGMDDLEIRLRNKGIGVFVSEYHVVNKKGIFTLFAKTFFLKNYSTEKKTKVFILLDKSFKPSV